MATLREDYCSSHCEYLRRVRSRVHAVVRQSPEARYTAIADIVEQGASFLAHRGHQASLFDFDLGGVARP